MKYQTKQLKRFVWCLKKEILSVVLLLILSWKMFIERPLRKVIEKANNAKNIWKGDNFLVDKSAVLKISMAKYLCLKYDKLHLQLLITNSTL